MNLIDNTCKDLLDLISCELFNKESSVSKLGLENLFSEAELQTMLPTTYRYLCTHDLKLQIKEYWVQRFYLNISNNIKVWKDHARIHKIMTEAGIPYVFLKGISSALYYENPIDRIMGDVDVYIPEKYIELATLTLTSDGAIVDEPMGNHHMALHFTNGTRIELHIAPNGMPNGEQANIVNLYLSDIIETSICKSIKFGDIQVTDDFHYGLISIMHIAKHLIKDGIGLRHLCDWAVFVYRTKDFKAVFEHSFRKIGLWKFTCILTATCSKYLGLPRQEWFAEFIDSASCDEIIMDVLSYGNFGRKSEQKKHTLLLHGESPGDISKKNVISQLMHLLIKKTNSKYRIANYLPLLQPILWIKVGFDYIFDIIRNRNENLLLFYKSSVEYKKYAEKFALYVPDV